MVFNVRQTRVGSYPKGLSRPPDEQRAVIQVREGRTQPDMPSSPRSPPVLLPAEAREAVREGAAWAEVASAWNLAAVRAALQQAVEGSVPCSSFRSGPTISRTTARLGELLTACFEGLCRARTGLLSRGQVPEYQPLRGRAERAGYANERRVRSRFRMQCRHPIPSWYAFPHWCRLSKHRQ